VKRRAVLRSASVAECPFDGEPETNPKGSSGGARWSRRAAFHGASTAMGATLAEAGDLIGEGWKACA
jgi:hypothetical protein